MLLLAPIVVMTVAVGAIQSLTPQDSVRRQLALLPEPLSVSSAALPAELSSSPPETASPIAAPVLVQRTPVIEVASTIGPDGGLEPAPPGEAIVAKLPPAARADKCVAPSLAGNPAQSTPVAAADPAAFGLMLAGAARDQTEDLVIYTDEYRQIGYPMGDVPALYGVCTDVVVRAYRALGIDLQVLVRKARLGTGDTSIDHRRTSTLRRFFARYGKSLPVTDFAEDYRPGDIVTYHSPAGRTSQSHIAIVSDAIAPSGRPMVVHNRGWGPQLEDALFSSDITGHYRYMSPAPVAQAALRKTAPFAHRSATQSSPAERMRLSVSAVR